MKYRYGLKFDAGYDVTDNFALYLTGGLSNNSYEFNRISDYRDGAGNAIDNDNQTDDIHDYFYGDGLKISLAKNINIGLEYNVQSVDFVLEEGAGGLFPAGVVIANDLEVIKFGLSYNF
ncbi:MAG: opacity protein-like surface antigen [Myxococcota bacterium]|jgi:opacity protein-like surface antigen